MLRLNPGQHLRQPLRTNAIQALPDLHYHQFDRSRIFSPALPLARLPVETGRAQQANETPAMQARHRLHFTQQLPPFGTVRLIIAGLHPLQVLAPLIQRQRLFGRHRWIPSVPFSSKRVARIPLALSHGEEVPPARRQTVLSGCLPSTNGCTTLFLRVHGLSARHPAGIPVRRLGTLAGCISKRLLSINRWSRASAQ